jgi:predicted phage terminase large subunit-like protein
MPPRHGKSELLSHWTPIWYLANWPNKRIILASYAADFASSWGRKVRNTIVSSGVSIQVSADSAAAARWETAQGGGMVTAGVGGPITGRGADLLIIDDPIKNRQEAQSAMYREHLWDWWTSTARTRLEPGASVIIIMTRWHDDDLVGRFLENQIDEFGDQWQHVRLPAIAEEEEEFRAEGEALWPDRYSVLDLTNARQAVGPEDWACLYQQRPALAEGGLFKYHWWEFYDREPDTMGEIFQFWDTAYKTGQANDYSACVTIGFDRKDYYVLNVWRDKVDYPNLTKVAQLLFRRWQPSRVFVEDAASGQSLVQSLRRETSLPVIPVRVDADKVSRANAVTGIMEAGRVKIPNEGEWLNPFLDEMGLFPNGAHDDQVDAFVGCLRQAVSYGLSRQQGPQVHDMIGLGRRNRSNPIGLDMDDPKYWDRD